MTGGTLAAKRAMSSGSGNGCDFTYGGQCAYSPATASSTFGSRFTPAFCAKRSSKSSDTSASFFMRRYASVQRELPPKSSSGARSSSVTDSPPCSAVTAAEVPAMPQPTMTRSRTPDAKSARGGDPVAAGALGAVDRLVGAREEALQRELRADRGRGADADGHLHGGDVLPHLDRVRLDLRANALGRHQRLVGGHFRLQHEELLAAEARDQVDGAHAREQQRGERLQARVPREVPVAVVDRLEMVDVDHEERERRARALGARLVVLEALGELAPVGEAGERVVLRELLELLVGALDRLLGGHPRGDVARHALVAAEGAEPVEDRLAGDLHVADLAIGARAPQQEVAKRLARLEDRAVVIPALVDDVGAGQLPAALA